MSYEGHELNEFKAAGWLNDDMTYKDEMQGQICDHILKMLSLFGEEGHSGFSASYALQCLEKLLRFKPLSPLTGEEDEWGDVSEMSGKPHYQNKRCSSVFKDGQDGEAYDIDGKVFWEGYTVDALAIRGDERRG